MSILIRRQDAIDAICEHSTELERRGITVLAVDNYKQATVDLLESLPFAQPEIIMCKECKHGKYDIFDRGMWCELHPLLDVKEDDFCSYAERI